MRVLLLLIVLPVGACLQAETIVRVPFELTGYYAFLDVQLEGETLSFAFDTAANGMAVNQAALERLGIEPTGTGSIVGATSSMTVSVLEGADFQFGTATLENRTVAVAPLDHLEQMIGRPIDGIVGRDVLDGRIVLLDHDREVIEIHPRSGFPFDDWGEPCPIRARGSIETEGEVRLLSGEVVRGSFFIDSGAGAHLTFNSGFVRRHDLLQRVGDTFPRTGRGFTGRTSADRVGRVASLSFCGYDFPADETPLPAVLSHASGGSLAGGRMAGLIGNPVLSRMNVVFDLPRDRIYLRPTDRWPDPILLDASGLVILRRADGATIVESVIPSSAAADAEIRPGDALLVVNGVPVDALELADVRDRLREIDREFELDMSRDGRPLTFRLRSRPLLSEF